MIRASKADAPDPATGRNASSVSSLHAAAEFDWDGDDPELLRRMMSRIGVDLETALKVFFNGAPGRYNMIAKTDLLPASQARCNLLDSIHRRIAAGFYLPDPDRGLGSTRAMMEVWIAAQDSDAQKGRVGRWVFERDLLDLPQAGPLPRMPQPTPLHETMLTSLRNRFARMIRRDRQVKPGCELDG